MTTRAPGLTAAMRRALECPGHADTQWKRAVEAGFLRNERVHYEGFGWGEGLVLTPRGQAALAAPRMTAAELELLVRIKQGLRHLRHLHGAEYRTFKSMLKKGWVCTGRLSADPELTPAGLTALNNMRAAMGSAAYREDLK